MTQPQSKDDIQRRITELKLELSRRSKKLETTGTVAGLVGIASVALFPVLSGGFLLAAGTGIASAVLGKKLVTENEIRAEIRRLEALLDNRSNT